MKKKPLLIYVDPKSSNVKEFNLSVKKVALLLLAAVFIIAFVSYQSVFLLKDFSENSKIVQLEKENDILQAELKNFALKLTEVRVNIDYLEEKDDQIRTMLDLPTIDEDVRQVGVGGSELSASISFNPSEVSFGNDLVSNMEQLEKLEREIRLEKVSYQKLLTTVERQQDSLRYLPVLIPVRNYYMSSGFGSRIHPIHKRRHFHKGVDLATQKGSPIIAPADGYVSFCGRNGGYGNFVQIDHKYGFETRFGHMNKIYVKKGQFVKRGDKIGEVGSTGLATSSHLHYEVRFKGNSLSPSNFFLNDIQY